MTNLIIKYLVDKKVSRLYKNLITATLKHACEINDIVLSWKKIKKFINPEKTGNEWISHTYTAENPPIACAKCKSPYWNVKR